jgi:hypothetical protein
MRSTTFTIETRGQGALIFGAPPGLAKQLTDEFLLTGLQTIVPRDTKEIAEFRQSRDIDYLLVFPPALNPAFNELIKSLVDSGESRLILVTHESLPPPKLALPIYKYLFYSDYVGAGEYDSHLLKSWIDQVASSQKILIPGDGLGEISLLGDGDLGHLLVSHTLRPSSGSGEKVYLGNPAGLSLLNLAYSFRTSLPYKVNLVFAREQSEIPVFDGTIYTPALEQVNYQLSDALEENLSKYLHAHLKPTPIPPKTEPAPLKKLTPLVKKSEPIFVPLAIHRPTKSFSLRPTNIISRGLFIALALYLGTLAFTGTVAALSLKRISSSLQNNELPPESSVNQFAVTYLQANWLAFTSLPGLSSKSWVIETSQLLDAYKQALAAFAVANQLSHTTSELTHYVFGSGSADIAASISRSRLESEELYQKLSLLDGSLPDIVPSILPDRYRLSYTQSKSALVKLKRSVITAKVILSITPDIIALGSRRKYGVLFQNNMELRATGGFIGSFGIMSFENGKLYDLAIFDVYDADGQLKGHIEPPAPIKDILGEANWYLRDSNFDPDFPTSARRAEWFIKKSLNQDLDGIIAVNVNTLVSLLGATGPLDIPDYNETITSGNLYERAQFHAEVNFFPGSTQKKEFLSSVANTLFASLPTMGAGDSLKAIRALMTSIEEKDTLISLVSSASNHVFETLGWNGQLQDLPCPTEGNCHKDYAMVVDSNFGVNKANYYVKRDIEEIITLDKNLSVGHVLRVNYRNTSTSTAWPAGAYKNYSRLYLPVGSTISGIKIGTVELAAKDYTLSTEHDREAIGYLLTFTVNSNVVLEVSYTTPQLPQENETLYTWYWQKQPGTSSQDSLTVYLNYPMFLRPSIISPTAQLGTQQLKFNFLNDTDHRLTVKFTK